MLNKIIVAIFSLVLFLLYFIGANFLGPGLADHDSVIGNGYKYEDTGYYEKVITFQDKKSNTIDLVIDSRVDGYVVVEEMIYVARRPRLSYVDKSVIKSELSFVCEFWLIDMSTHEVKKLDDGRFVHNLNCNF